MFSDPVAEFVFIVSALGFIIGIVQFYLGD